MTSTIKYYSRRGGHETLATYTGEGVTPNDIEITRDEYVRLSMELGARNIHRELMHGLKCMELEAQSHG